MSPSYLPKALYLDWVEPPCWDYFDSATQENLRSGDPARLGEEPLELPLAEVAQNPKVLEKLYSFLCVHTQDDSARQALVKLAMPGMLDRLTRFFTSGTNGEVPQLSERVFRCVVVETTSLLGNFVNDIVEIIYSLKSPLADQLRTLQPKLDRLRFSTYLRQEQVDSYLKLLTVTRNALDASVREFLSDMAEDTADLDTVQLSLDCREAAQRIKAVDAAWVRKMQEFKNTLRESSAPLEHRETLYRIRKQAMASIKPYREQLDDLLGAGSLAIWFRDSSAAAVVDEFALLERGIGDIYVAVALNSSLRTLNQYDVYLKIVESLPSLLQHELNRVESDAFASVNDPTGEITKSADLLKQTVESNILAVRRFSAYVAIEAAVSLLKTYSKAIRLLPSSQAARSY